MGTRGGRVGPVASPAPDVRSPAASALRRGQVALPRAPRLVLDAHELARPARVFVASRRDEVFAVVAGQRERASARAEFVVAGAPAASRLVARLPRRVGYVNDAIVVDVPCGAVVRGLRRHSIVVSILGTPRNSREPRRAKPERRAHRPRPLGVPVHVHRRPRLDDDSRGRRQGQALNQEA